ncbi:APC family permease [Saccharopolyspora hirsuta]|uniref:Amino acid permease n=1 Tax=Saccharopolyspora hirsuta TaxID=1837 RepID=A0A5M7BBB5_SACHI|nr:APC family permease [Saccharopolyspora hirsuta]KAA5826752.1 amino acid permease [Saccharopolyspora hirsuta]MBF6507724.1 amino acid permease [Nocardia farcinica]
MKTSAARENSDTDEDSARLRELGYEPQLKRGLGVLGNITMGFATISPVVGLYAVVLVGATIAGPRWVWALPVCLVGQCLLLALYAELSSEFPISGGAYQWTRRLLGPSYAWFTGWISLCSSLLANTTIAYLAAPWAFTLVGVTPTPNQLVVAAAVFVVVCSLTNMLGVDVLRRALAMGVVAEAIASVLVGVALLLVFRSQPWSILTEGFGTEALFDGSGFAAFVAAVAVGGWAFIGFDACVSTSEETRNATRHVPRAIWIALLSVGLLVILNAFAVVLTHPDPASVVAGADADPVTTAVVASFGDWSAKPFVVVVIIAFLACGMAAQGSTARALYSVARDDVLPLSKFLRTVSRRSQAPIGGAVAVTAVACVGLLLALNSAAMGSLITFGTSAFYLTFFLVALAALVARLRGTWVPAGRVRLGRPGTALNFGAVLWLGFEFVNITWPRALLAPVGAPWYQVWAAPLGTALIVLVGLVYFAVAKPRDRVVISSSFADRSTS